VEGRLVGGQDVRVLEPAGFAARVHAGAGLLLAGERCQLAPTPPSYLHAH